MTLEGQAISTSDLSKGFDREVYYSLKTIEEADRTRRNLANFDEFLHAAAVLIRESKVEHSFGVFLLHRHFMPEIGEVMLEYAGNASLIMRPMPPEGRGPFAPCRWAFRGAMSISLEFSTDPAAIEASSHVGEFPELYGSLVDKFGLSGLIGLATIRRATLMAHSGKHFVERSYYAGRASVVTVESANSNDEFIETTWSYSRIIAGCRKRHNCVTRYTCVSRPGDLHAPVPSGHDDRGTHEYVPVCRPHGCV